MLKTIVVWIVGLIVVLLVYGALMLLSLALGVDNPELFTIRSLVLALVFNSFKKEVVEN